MIGSGVYLLPASLGAFGSVSIFGWIVSGLGAFLLAYVFVMLCRLRPQSGGMVRQVRDGLGRFFGFHASLLYWLGGWVGNGAIALAATGYLSTFFPELKAPLAGALCTVAIIWALTALNLLGARRVADFEGGSLLIGLLPVMGVAVLGWFAFDPVIFQQSWNVTGKPDASVVPATFSIIFWAFVGLESASVAAAVVRDPARDVPIATLGGVALAAIVYLAASFAITGLLSAEQLSTSSAPFADAVARWVGAGAAAIVAACAVLKAMGTLSGWLLVTAESARSGAESGVFPRPFFEPAGRPPKRNLVIVATLMSVMLLLSSAAPTLAAQFTVLSNLATLLYLVIYVYCALSLWRATTHPGTRALALAAGGFCVWAVSASDLTQLLYLTVLCAVGLPIYLAMGKGDSPH